MTTKIYFLKDPNNGEIKYIGKTETSLQDRLSAHVYQAKECKYERYDWLKALLEKGLKPTIHLIEEVKDEEWEEKEKHWIETFKTMGFCLENIVDGGEGSLGWVPSESTRKKMSLAKLKSHKRPKIRNIVGNITGQPPLTQAVEILRPEEMRFASLVADGSSLMEAFKDAYPDLASSKWVSRYAHRLAKDPKIRTQVEELQQVMRFQFIINAPRALDRLEEMAETAGNARVKLDANIEILNRAGLQPPQRTETLHIGLWGRMSSEDIKGMIKRNLDGLTSVREDKNTEGK